MWTAALAVSASTGKLSKWAQLSVTVPAPVPVDVLFRYRISRPARPTMGDVLSVALYLSKFG